MKRLYVAFLALLLLSGCYSYREYPVEYDYSYHGKFKKYKSFAFMQNTTSITDSTVSKDIIEDIIKSRLQTQGYRFREDKPNLLVAYKIYFDSLNFRGYDQPDIETWVKVENEDEEYNPRKYDLRKGTLLIQLYDRRQERSIWQGYATGVYGNIYFNNERQLKIAVRSILDRYQFLAEDFMENKEFILEEEPINN
ncbi:MAG: DUF4136 domain-containing protein [Cyclobacteriaceae bacterium]|nr:DUF4136 domain-containing protein [Cyclobacteriaceae bacterium]